MRTRPDRNFSITFEHHGGEWTTIHYTYEEELSDGTDTRKWNDSKSVAVSRLDPGTRQLLQGAWLGGDVSVVGAGGLRALRELLIEEAENPSSQS